MKFIKVVNIKKYKNNIIYYAKASIRLEILEVKPRKKS